MPAPAPSLPMPAGALPRLGYGTGTFWGHYRTGVPKTEVVRLRPLSEPSLSHLLTSPSDAAAQNSALVAAIRSAIAAGVRHIDCAEMYGSELSVGEGIRQAIAAGEITRPELWVTSKALNESKESAATLRAACAGSLQRLGLEYLDLYLLHSPFGAPEGDDRHGEAELSAERQQQIWGWMEALHADGLARHIGCSNHRVSDLQHLCATARVRPAVNQVEFNPLLLGATEPLLAFCKAEAIVVEAYSALSSLVYDGAKGNAALDAAVEQIAAALGRSAGAVLLRWNLHKGTVVISTSTKPARVEEALGVFEFELSEDQIAEIDGAAREGKVHKQFWQKSLAKQ